VTAILRAAARRGIELCNLYEMQLQPDPLDPGLLVGYGNIKDTLIDGPLPRWPKSSERSADPGKCADAAQVGSDRLWCDHSSEGAEQRDELADLVGGREVRRGVAEGAAVREFHPRY